MSVNKVLKVSGENLRKLEVVLERYIDIIGGDEEDEWDEFADNLLDKIQRKLKGDGK